MFGMCLERTYLALARNFGRNCFNEPGDGV